jgi:hypothetical protein
MRPSTLRPARSRRAGTERPWALPVGRVAADLGADPVAGLAPGEAAGRLDRFGENVLVERRRKPAWRLLAEQSAPGVAGRLSRAPWNFGGGHCWIRRHPPLWA